MSEHDPGEGEVMNASQSLGEPFVISGEASKARGPGEASLDHPAARQQNESAFCSCMFDHFQLNAMRRRRILRGFSGVSLIDIGQLHMVSGDLLHCSSELLAPYGQLMASGTGDPYLYANLFQDTEYGGHDAWYRNFSAEQVRWLTPDPYNGSYDLNNPQSLNRYAYVNDNPLGYTDPSGLAGGWATGIGGSPCKAYGDISNGTGTINGFNPCDPLASVITFGLSAVLIPLADQIDQGMNTAFSTTYFNTSVQTAQIVPYIAAAITIACSIDNNKQACGPSGLTSLIPGAGGDVGKGVGDGLAVASAIAGSMCLAGTVANPVCDAFLVYNIADTLYSFFNNLFNGPAQFTGSLLPRPTDLGGLGTASIGIPNKNLTNADILGQPSQYSIPSPGITLR